MKIRPLIDTVLRCVATASLASCLPGCAEYNNPDFGGYRTVTLDDGLKLKVAIEKNYTAHSSEAQIMGRFTFKLRLTDPTQEFASATITTIEGLYENGDRTRLDKPWTKNFNELRKSLGNDSPLYVNVKSHFFHHSNVTVTFSGYLTTQDGKRILFSGKEMFKAGWDSGTTILLHD